MEGNSMLYILYQISVVIFEFINIETWLHIVKKNNYITIIYCAFYLIILLS
jgi:hypothetical protein